MLTCTNKVRKESLNLHRGGGNSAGRFSEMAAAATRYKAARRRCSFRVYFKFFFLFLVFSSMLTKRSGSHPRSQTFCQKEPLSFYVFPDSSFLTPQLRWARQRATQNTHVKLNQRAVQSGNPSRRAHSSKHLPPSCFPPPPYKNYNHNTAELVRAR